MTDAAKPSLINVISLGAGVQSSTMALMAAHGEITPMPECAIFADTGDEPDGVYETLRWLRRSLPFPVHMVTRGVLSEALLAGDDMARVPFFVKAGGLSKRQCTRNWKVRVIRREVRRLFGGRLVTQWIGISADEAHRMRPSDVGYITNRWPLALELGLSRVDCLAWLGAHDYPIPGKSACVFCPYHRDDQWLELQMSNQAGWAKAVAVDAALRTPANVVRFHGELFAHKSCVPLDQIDFRSAATKAGQLDLWGEECEGMCGV